MDMGLRSGLIILAEAIDLTLRVTIK